MFTIGIDFGTQSGRVILVETHTGVEAASVIVPYKNGVIDQVLPSSGKSLSPDWALQDPNDYLDVLGEGIPALLGMTGVNAGEIAGMGIAFTSSTVLPITEDGTPLCALEAWRDEPHAWVKLWKHHAAQLQAEQMTRLAQAWSEDWLSFYGGKISSEWFFSKALQVLQEAPHVFGAADHFIEGGDWIVQQLTGTKTRSLCLAGYKAFFQEGKFPSREYFSALDSAFARLLDQCLNQTYVPPGTRVGYLTEKVASWLELSPSTAVAVANGDGFATVPAVCVTGPGQMVTIIGTSSTHILLSDRCTPIDGICGIVRDGIVPGYYSYEAGQSAVGDMFAWFVDNAVAPEYHLAARQAEMTIYEYLEREAAKLKAGESGLLVLDWWNGNRSMLVDASRTGLIVGATLATRAPEIYRALIEATAYGTRLIVEAFEAGGMSIDELILTGGIPQKNPLLVQIYADVTGKKIRLGGSAQAAALGAAIYAAVAANLYPDINTAAAVMGKLNSDVILPEPVCQGVYEGLHREYKRLYEYFGDERGGGNGIMARLKAIKAAERGRIPSIDRLTAK